MLTSFLILYPHSVERQLESGLPLDLYHNVLAALLSLVKQNVKVYESQEAYVSERSAHVSPNVKLANVKNLFISFFGSLTMVLVVFVLHLKIWSRKKNRNRRKPLKANNLRRKKIQNAVQNAIQLNVIQYDAPKEVRSVVRNEARNETRNEVRKEVRNESRPGLKERIAKLLSSAQNDTEKQPFIKLSCSISEISDSDDL